MRRALVLLPVLVMLAALSPAHAAEVPQDKVLRVTLRAAETGFDPAQVTDKYSRDMVGNIFDTPLRYDYLARPLKLMPGVTTGLPEVHDDFTRFIFQIKPGIYFADDAAFDGRKRELTGADLIYTIKRHFDPRWKSGHLFKLEGMDILGLAALRKEALADKKPFDYERPVEGLRLLDRYTVELRTGHPEPRLGLYFADPMLSLVAREVVEKYGDRIMEHPVGTNAWRLTQWRRSSRMVFEKNPNFRELYYDEAPPAGNPVLAEQARLLQGKRLPMIDRVEVAVIEEAQPRWLSFLRGEFDLLEELPPDYAPVAVPHDRVAPNLARLGLRATRYSRNDITTSYFNMQDPVVGGFDPAHVALRRAVGLAVDLDKQVRLARRGQAMAAQGIIAPGLTGYDAEFKSENSEHNLARAKALLDLYGYVDRDGDGWREQPDGSPLTLEYATQPDDQNRQLAELWQKDMTALGVRMVFRFAKFPDNLKAANAGQLMMWGMGWSADVPDGENLLALAYGQSFSNKARFKLPAYDALYDRQHSLPDGPERLAVMQQAERLLVAYAPYKIEVHRLYTDMVQPWLLGFERNPYQRDFWTYVDIDQARLTKKPS
jgi:ABC-type transport system substrate-binding protein